MYPFSHNEINPFGIQGSRCNSLSSVAWNDRRSTEANTKLAEEGGQQSRLPKSSVKSSDLGRDKGRRYKNVTIGDGICQSIDIRNTASAFGIMKDCRVIEGFLQIVLIENNSERDFQPISFPLLREITGYLLLYRVNGLKTLSNLFPNLEVIRGNILLTDYAFMVYEMQNLQEVRYLLIVIIIIIIIIITGIVDLLRSRVLRSPREKIYIYIYKRIRPSNKSSAKQILSTWEERERERRTHRRPGKNENTFSRVIFQNKSIYEPLANIFPSEYLFFPPPPFFCGSFFAFRSIDISPSIGRVNN